MAASTKPSEHRQSEPDRRLCRTTCNHRSSARWCGLCFLNHCFAVSTRCARNATSQSVHALLVETGSRAPESKERSWIFAIPRFCCCQSSRCEFPRRAQVIEGSIEPEGVGKIVRKRPVISA